ncbi:MAG: phage tail protein [Lewinellaceae bacterium]|nr:phage tail protein [Lewinellaceae bacterium]
MASASAAAGVDYYPHLGFYYKVQFSISPSKNDARFQSVSGLSVTCDIETHKEGGENRFEHKLPGRTKYADLTLKRGMFTDSVVTRWCQAALTTRIYVPADIVIILMNEKSEPLRVWNVFWAFPKRWEFSELKSDENTIMVETLELSYRYFTLLL